MKKIIIFFTIITAVLVLNTAYVFGSDISNKNIILKNNYTNFKRNELLYEDIMLFQKELPKRHVDLYSLINEKEFMERTSKLAEDVDKMTNAQVYVELQKIIGSLHDLHTNIGSWPNGGNYPLECWMFDGKPYITNITNTVRNMNSSDEMLYARIVKIDGVDIDNILELLTDLIPYENDASLQKNFPRCLMQLTTLEGLGIITANVSNQHTSVFTVEKDGIQKDYIVNKGGGGEGSDIRWVVTSKRNVITGKYEKYYDYKYLSEDKALYFEYNSCENMSTPMFSTFNNAMFQNILDKDIEKFIIDLRSNRGGDSKIIWPFVESLNDYLSNGRNDVKVYILISRSTASSGQDALLRILNAIPSAITVGEPTGQALVRPGQMLTFKLPNTGLNIAYSTKLVDDIKWYPNIKNKGGEKEFIPDILINPTIEDYINNHDAVMKYILEKQAMDLTGQIIDNR